MNGIELIQPNSGQTSWGAAINNNFKTLYVKYKNTLSELQSLYDKINLLDIVHTSNEDFVYMQDESNVNIIKPNSGKTMSDTWRALSLGSLGSNGTPTEFKLEEYNNYDAFFVMTAADKKVTWQNLDWNTGDLLIVHKNTGSELTVSGVDSTAEQWKNMMGGFYEPISSTMETNGTQITRYKKLPNVASDSIIDLKTSHLFYKPTKYTSGAQNILTFTPYSMNNNQETELTMPEVELELPTDVYAVTNIIEISSFEPDQLIDFTFNNVTINSLGDISISFVVFYNTEVDGVNQEIGEFINFPYRCIYNEKSLELKITTNVGYFTLPTTGSYKIQCIMTTYVNPTSN